MRYFILRVDGQRWLLPAGTTGTDAGHLMRMLGGLTPVIPHEESVAVLAGERWPTSEVGLEEVGRVYVLRETSIGSALRKALQGLVGKLFGGGAS